MIKPSSGISFEHSQSRLQRYSNYCFVIKLEMTAYMKRTLPLQMFVTEWPRHIFRRGCDFLTAKRV